MEAVGVDGGHQSIEPELDDPLQSLGQPDDQVECLLAADQPAIGHYPADATTLLPAAVKCGSRRAVTTGENRGQLVFQQTPWPAISLYRPIIVLQESWRSEERTVGKGGVRTGRSR